MANLAELISRKILNAEVGDNRSYKLNKGIAIIAKFGFELLGSNPDQITVCGSSRDGLKLSKEGDIGDIDFMITNSQSFLENKIEEANFVYDDKFPCHCKCLVDGGAFVNRTMMLSNTSALSLRLYEIAGLYKYNRQEGGIQGYKFDEWLHKLPEIFKCIYLLKRAIKQTGGKLTQDNGTTETDLKEIKIWEEEYSEAEKDQFLHIGLQFIGLFSVVLDTSDPETDITKFLSDVLLVDTIYTNRGSLEQSIFKMTFFGSSIEKEVIKNLLPYKNDILSDGATLPTRVIAKLLSDFMPKFSVDWIAAFYVSGWPRPAEEWISRDRNWPSKKTVCIIAKEGFNLVGKPSPKHDADESEWYLSFARAEFKLCQSLSEVQKLCYKAFKILVKYGVESAVDDDEKDKDDDIRSYFLRTAFLWVCERADPADWTNDKLLNNLETLVNVLIEAYREKKLQHYFVREMNLLDRTPINKCQNIVNKLSGIKSKAPDFFNELANGEFFAYDAII